MWAQPRVAPFGLLCIQHDDEAGKCAFSSSFDLLPHRGSTANKSVDCSDRKPPQESLLFSFKFSFMSFSLIHPLEYPSWDAWGTTCPLPTVISWIRGEQHTTGPSATVTPHNHIILTITSSTAPDSWATWWVIDLAENGSCFSEALTPCLDVSVASSSAVTRTQWMVCCAVQVPRNL